MGFKSAKNSICGFHTDVITVDVISVLLVMLLQVGESLEFGASGS